MVANVRFKVKFKSGGTGEESASGVGATEAAAVADAKRKMESKPNVEAVLGIVNKSFS